MLICLMAASRTDLKPSEIPHWLSTKAPVSNASFLNPNPGGQQTKTGSRNDPADCVLTFEFYSPIYLAKLPAAIMALIAQVSDREIK